MCDQGLVLRRSGLTRAKSRVVDGRFLVGLNVPEGSEVKSCLTSDDIVWCIEAHDNRKGTDMISPQLQMAVVHATADDRRRSAAARAESRASSSQAGVAADSVTLRYSVPDDEPALARLAALDSSTPPAQPVLLAEVAGRLRAAIALSDGRVVADPFHPTAHLVDLLRARADQLGSQEQTRRSRRLGSWAARLRAPAWR